MPSKTKKSITTNASKARTKAQRLARQRRLWAVVLLLAIVVTTLGLLRSAQQTLAGVDAPNGTFEREAQLDNAQIRQGQVLDRQYDDKQQSMVTSDNAALQAIGEVSDASRL